MLFDWPGSLMTSYLVISQNTRNWNYPKAKNFDLKEFSVKLILNARKRDDSF